MLYPGSRNSTWNLINGTLEGIINESQLSWFQLPLLTYQDSQLMISNTEISQATLITITRHK